MAQGNHQVASPLVPFHTCQVVSVLSLIQSTMLMAILFFLHILLIFLLYINLSKKKKNSTVHSDDWIIDSGATDHMVHSINFVTKITSIAHITVNLPNGESVIVTFCIYCPRKCSVFLVLLSNLISFSKLTSSLRCCIFLSSYCFIQDLEQWEDDWDG